MEQPGDAAAGGEQPPEPPPTRLLDLHADALVELLSHVSEPAIVAALLSSCRSLQALKQRPDLAALWLARQRPQRDAKLARTEQELLVLLALDRGAPVATQQHRAAALLKASGAGWAAAVQRLVRMGVDVSSPGQLALVAASSGGHAAVCEMLLAAGVDMMKGHVALRPKGGVSAMWWACRNGHAACVEMLLQWGEQHGAAAVCRTSDAGNTPLTAACHWGHAAVCRLLLQGGRGMQLGLDLNARGEVGGPRSVGGKTALYHACREGHAACVEVLLEGAGTHLVPDTPDARGLTPLIAAAMAGHAAAVQALLQHGPQLGLDVNRATNSTGTALHRAADLGHCAVLRLLVAAPGINVNARDFQQGRTALHYAAANGSLEGVEVLVGVPGVDTGMQDRDGRTARDLACASGAGHRTVRAILRLLGAGFFSRQLGVLKSLWSSSREDSD